VTTKTKKRGGTSDAAPAQPLAAVTKLTDDDIQKVLDDLVWRNGENVVNWANWPELLAQHGLRPEQIRPTSTLLAAQRARHRLLEASRNHNADPKARFRVEHPGSGDPDLDPEMNRPVPIPEQEPEPYNDSETPEDTETNVAPTVQEFETMKVKESVARMLLSKLGFVAAEKAKPKELGTLLSDLSKAEEGDLKELEDTKDRILKKKLLKAISAGKAIEIVGEEEAEDKEEETTAPPAAAEEAYKGNGSAKKGGKGKGKKAAKAETAAPKKTKEKKVKAPKADASGLPREGSITAAILNCLRAGPVSKEAIVKKVLKAFPDRKEDTIKNTVAWNIATGLPRKGIKVNKSEEGYAVAK
jgi:hypothetical protein